MELAKRVLEGDVRAAAKLMRCIEDDLPEAAVELQHLYKYADKAFTIGITGAPGVGKSTLVDCLIAELRQRQMTVGVVAIDPTSPFTGGALLGDRIRMRRHSTDQGVFIRSLANRGWTGGLARATCSMIRVLDALGKDIILVEAVGSGQGEVSISRVVDTTIVVLAPGLGDEIQTMKAGILETADVYVVNKADKDGAENLKIQLQTMLAIKAKPKGGWEPAIVLTKAAEGHGVEELVETTLRHKEYLMSTGEIMQKRQERTKLELIEMIEHSLRLYVKEMMDREDMKNLLNNMLSRKGDPYSLAKQILIKIIGNTAETTV